MRGRAMSQTALLLLVPAAVLLATPSSGQNATGEEYAAEALKAVVPGGKCPASIPRATSTERPTVIGPGSGQKIVVMSLPKMGSTTMAHELATLGYGTSHNLGDAFGCEGVEVIANACEARIPHLDKNHPDATWIVLYDPSFVAWFTSSMRWLWVTYCPRGVPKVRSVAAMWSTAVEQAARFFDVEFTMSSYKLKHLVLDESEKICKDEKLSQDSELMTRMMNQYLEDAAFAAAMRQRYELFHAFLYCFLEDKPHVVLDVRGDPQPYKKLAPWLRNGTQEIDVTQLFQAVNVHGNGTDKSIKSLFTTRNPPPGGCHKHEC